MRSWATRETWRAWSAGVLATLLLGASARAETPQTSKDAMLEQWRQATVEYTQGHYEEAAQSYERAYRLYEEPALLYNLAQAYRKRGAFEQALATYRAYLLRSPPDAPDRELARKRAQELETSLAARKAAGLPSPAPLPRAPAPAVDTPASLASAAPVPPDAPHRRWWPWGLVGALVAGGVTAALILENRAPTPVGGTVGTATIP